MEGLLSGVCVLLAIQWQGVGFVWSLCWVTWIQGIPSKIMMLISIAVWSKEGCGLKCKDSTSSIDRSAKGYLPSLVKGGKYCESRLGKVWFFIRVHT